MKLQLLAGSANLPSDWHIPPEDWQQIETASGVHFAGNLREEVEACVRRLANAGPLANSIDPRARRTTPAAASKDIRDQIHQGLEHVEALVRFMDGVPGKGMSAEAACWVQGRLREPSYQQMLLAAIQRPGNNSEPAPLSLEAVRGTLIGLRERLLEIERDLPKPGRPLPWELHRFIRDLAAIFEAAGRTASRSRLPDKHRHAGPFHRFLRSIYVTVPEHLRPISDTGKIVSPASLLTHHLSEALKDL